MAVKERRTLELFSFWRTVGFKSLCEGVAMLYAQIPEGGSDRERSNEACLSRLFQLPRQPHLEDVGLARTRRCSHKYILAASICLYSECQMKAYRAAE
jgi:hypothetical protein